ncbi:hypothetical protein ACHAW5_009154 [Stephanodiscus triporus]|uniref:Cytochrome P450 n=1 Tax=Stephanodiscus triporus TaxID=2934178 RepID=A0ABD3N0N9_9STRA
MITLNLSSDFNCRPNLLQNISETDNSSLTSPIMSLHLFSLLIRQNRWILEGELCNLPTVVWRPRFVNYCAQDDVMCEDELDWDDDDSVTGWARNFLNESRLNRPNFQSNCIAAEISNKKMGSSSITNILPRMERLNGPYGMYATVYGVQTKVIHVAHPVPARAILTGAGVLEIGGTGGIPEGSFWDYGGFPCLQSIGRIFRMRMTDRNHTDAFVTSKKMSMKRRMSSSSQRMLTGSTKYPAYDHFKNFSGDGVFTADGSDWKAKRASVIHCLLRSANMDDLLEIEANRAADSFVSEVANALEIRKSRGKDEKKTPVLNVVPMLQRSTIGLIYRLITHNNVDFSSATTARDKGRDCAERAESSSLKSSSPRSSADLASINLEEVSSEYSSRSKYSEQEEQIKSLLPTYLQSVTRIRMIVLAQSRSIWYLLPRWLYRAFSPMYRDEERTMAPIRKFAQLACENALAGSPLALLSLRDSHSSYAGGRGTSTKVSKDLLDEAITLLFAGQDTSAATLSWTLHLLSLHPDKQERAFMEIRSVIGEVKTKTISKNMISRMPYLDAVIKESMRLYPVAPFIVRKLTTEITIPIDEEFAGSRKDAKKTISMPASTFACIWIYALHRNIKLWDRPDEFLPERWIDPKLRSRDLGQEEYGAYMPFAIGPRNCLGQPMAQVILRIVLARILSKYMVLDPRIEALRKVIKEEDKVGFSPIGLRKDMQAGFTVLPSNGLNLQLMERT